MLQPLEDSPPAPEPTRPGEPARSPGASARSARPTLQRPPTPSHVWFAFDRWLSVEDQPGDDDFVLA